MSGTYPVRHLSTSIARSAEDAYAYLADPANLPSWAAGLGGSVLEEDGVLVVEGDLGRVEVAFVERNDFGVLDHTVTLSSGEAFLNPLRVIPNGEGCEVVFTLFRMPGVDDAAFESDAAAVTRDLATLKAILEP